MIRAEQQATSGTARHTWGYMESTTLKHTHTGHQALTTSYDDYDHGSRGKQPKRIAKTRMTILLFRRVFGNLSFLAIVIHTHIHTHIYHLPLTWTRFNRARPLIHLARIFMHVSVLIPSHLMVVTSGSTNIHSSEMRTHIYTREKREKENGKR